MTPRILIFTDTYDELSDLMGVVPSWVSAFRSAGAQVLVLSQHSGKDKNGVIEINKRKHPSSIVRLLLTWRALYRLRNSYDVLLIAMAPTWAALLSPLARLLGKRAYLWYAVWRGTWKLRLAEKLVNGILCSVRESFPFRSGKVNPVGQAIDTERFSFAPHFREPGRILALGRISPVKRLEILIGALGLVSEPLAPRSVVIAGAPKSPEDRVYESRLRDGIRRAGLEDIVSWLGMIPYASTPHLYRRADIVVNMTPAGSFDKTMLEAMASGALIVASNPSLRRFLPADVAERLLFRQDDSADMARVLEGVFDMSDLEKDELREACREAVRVHHSITQWSTRVLQIMA